MTNTSKKTALLWRKKNKKKKLGTERAVVYSDRVMQEDVRRLLHSHVNIHTWIGSGREDRKPVTKTPHVYVCSRSENEESPQSNPIQYIPLPYAFLITRRRGRRRE